jgi:hypothetical protein
MPATVMNYTGASVQSDNMHLVQYACDQINAPGKAATYSFPASTPSCAYSTSRPTGTSGSSGSSGHKNGAAKLSVEMGPMVLLAASFLFGTAAFAL